MSEKAGKFTWENPDVWEQRGMEGKRQTIGLPFSECSYWKYFAPRIKRKMDPDFSECPSSHNIRDVEKRQASTLRRLQIETKVAPEI
jgi:hypothetical protein